MQIWQNGKINMKIKKKNANRQTPSILVQQLATMKLWIKKYRKTATATPEIIKKIQIIELYKLASITITKYTFT